MSGDIGIGRLIQGEAFRDAVHVAVHPVTAASVLAPGAEIGFINAGDTELVGSVPDPIGIVDPFLRSKVRKGERFYMFLKPGSITSLRHEWTHPAFPSDVQQAQHVAECKLAERSASEEWMRNWAIKFVSHDYYGESNSDRFDEDTAYEFAIRAGHEHHIGPYESARDHIDDEWWTHWELITGEKGDRESYFSCAC